MSRPAGRLERLTVRRRRLPTFAFRWWSILPAWLSPSPKCWTWSDLTTSSIP